MIIEEIIEGAVSIFGRSGNKTVRKYRCTSGSRKGRIVAKASTCTAPRNVAKGVTLKKTKARKGSQMKLKTKVTKRANPASRRLSSVNTGMKRLKPRRSGKGKRI